MKTYWYKDFNIWAITNGKKNYNLHNCFCANENTDEIIVLFKWRIKC